MAHRGFGFGFGASSWLWRLLLLTATAAIVAVASRREEIRSMRADDDARVACAIDIDA